MAKFAKTLPKANVMLASLVHPQGARWLLVISLSALNWGFGWLPTPTGPITLTPSAHAQNLRANTQGLWPKVPHFVNVIQDVEPIRQQSWEKIQSQMQGKSMPAGGCQSRQLPPLVKATCDDFFSRCVRIIQEHGLTLNEFNAMQDHRNKQTKLGIHIDRELRKLK